MQKGLKTGIEIEGLSYAYGAKQALCDLNLMVRSGHFTAILGPNGAGKSTLFHLLTRILKVQDGSIAILNADLVTEPLRAMANLGVVFQQQTLDLDLTVRQNLAYFAALHGLPAHDLDKKIDASLASLSLLERSGEKVRALNGGHRRRVEIARALLHDPKVLLLDEPTVGLDVPSRRALVDHVHNLCRRRGLTALWATHLVDEVHRDDDLIIMHEGKIRALGSVTDILQEQACDDVGQLFEKLVMADRSRDDN